MSKPQIEIRTGPSPLANMTRQQCLEAVNEMDDNMIKNLLRLVKSPKAKGYLSSDIKFAVLKKFI